MRSLQLIEITVILVISICANTVHAQMATDTLTEVVITDSKIERPVRLSSRPVEIITSDIIKKYQGKSLSQLLTDQVGISINGANSNPASIKNIYIRGAAPGYTLILIDGLPASDASTIGSTIDLRLLDINQIERVEVAKGSQSTLYGSDAIAGVINIITKKGDKDAFNTHAHISAGSYNTTDAGLSINGTTGGLNYNLGYQYTTSDGVSEALDLNDTGTFDDDGMKKQVTTVNLKYDINDQWSIAPSLQVSSFDSDYDGGAFFDGADTYESDLTNLGVRVVYDNDAFKLNAAYNIVEANRSFFTGFGDFMLDGTTQNADVFATYVKEDISLIGGVHYQEASIIDMNTTETDPSWNIISPYSNFIYHKDRFQVEAGLRLNNHSDFGSNINYSITPSIFITDDLKFYASYATAFKAPALYELYGAFGANTDLDPQTSATFEIGSNYYFNQGSLSLTYFNRTIEGVIQYTEVMQFVYQYQNFAKQQDQGIEITSRITLPEGFNILLSYAYLDGNITDDNNMETNNLYKRPAHKVGFNIDYTPTDKWNIRFINQYNSKLKDKFFDNNTFASSIVDLRQYLRSGLSIQFKPTKKSTLFLHLNNIWNNEYYETYGFTVPRFNFKLGGSYEF